MLRKMIFLTVGVLFIVVACQKKDDWYSTRPYPRIQTLDVTEISPTGALFNGEMLRKGTEPVDDHGFMWTDNPKSGMMHMQERSLGPLEKEGVFQCLVQYGIPKGKRFYVRAYVHSGTLTVFGRWKSFISAGCYPPELHSVTPVPVEFMGEVVLHGIHFGNNAALASLNAYVSPDLVYPCEIKYFSDTIIKFIPPVALSSHYVDMVLDLIGQKFPFTIEFYPPVIERVSPHNPGLQDTLTIYGSHFKPYPAYQSVYYGDRKCMIRKATREMIQVTFYNNFPTNEYHHIKVVIGDMETVSPDSVLIRP